jgi:DNA-binding transcriptional LysR family regulator
MLRREALSWVADTSFAPGSASPLPLLALPDTCSLQRFVIRKLEAGRIPYFIAHTASGVGGLQSALSAGLGVSCLNASAIPPGSGIRQCGAMLPPLPEVEFSLLVNRASTVTAVDEIAQILAERLA